MRARSFPTLITVIESPQAGFTLGPRLAEVLGYTFVDGIHDTVRARRIAVKVISRPPVYQGSLDDGRVLRVDTLMGRFVSDPEEVVRRALMTLRR